MFAESCLTTPNSHADTGLQLSGPGNASFSLSKFVLVEKRDQEARGKGRKNCKSPSFLTSDPPTSGLSLSRRFKLGSIAIGQQYFFRSISCNPESKSVNILVTGAAGFIGFHVCRELLARGDHVYGLDNFNDYYDVQLKRDRIAHIIDHDSFQLTEMDLADRRGMQSLFSGTQFDRVIHLGAQAGVRHSINSPATYVDSNLVGFANVLEGCRNQQTPHLVFASSSSVYGSNTELPLSVQQNVDHPLSLYAATKKANEMMAHVYSHLYGLPTTGLRFFTVYGPWGRPDMAIFLFTRAILEDRPIDVFNHGRMQRDMTYIDDITRGVVLVSDHIPQPDPDWPGQTPSPATSSAPYRIYNIGNHQPVELMTLIKTVEDSLGKTAQKRFLEMQPGDVTATYADMQELHREIGFQPNTSIEFGVRQFVDWYCDYYRITL